MPMWRKTHKVPPLDEATGFLMICLGGFFISNSIFHSQRNLVVSYVLLPMGFMILLSGIFWATYCQASKNKEMFNHVLRQHLAAQDLPLATIDSAVFVNPTENSHDDGHRRKAFENSQGMMKSFKERVIKVEPGIHGFCFSIDADCTVCERTDNAQDAK
ncbi:hypothetical protein STEG23_031831 [Scotinomys teguina]